MEITIDINKMCFRYQLRTEKKFPVIIRGLHSETDLCNIKCDSTGPRHLVHNETFKIKKKSTLTTRVVILLLWGFCYSSWIWSHEQTTDIYDLDNFWYHKLIVESSRKRKRSVTMHKLPNLKSHSKLLFKTPKCVTFSEEYISLNYPKSKKSINYGEGHTSNWIGCFACKKQISRKNSAKKKIKAVQSINENLRNQSVKMFVLHIWLVIRMINTRVHKLRLVLNRK